MKPLLAAVALSLIPSVATADAPQAYVTAGATLGGEHVGYLGATVDGGLRIKQTPLFVHAQLGAGAATQLLMTDGTYRSLRAGLEGRACARYLCLGGGVDLGMRDVYLEYTSDAGNTSVDEDGSYGLIVPRIGAEIGHRVKVSGNVELPVALREDEVVIGLGLSLGVGYAF